MVWHQREWAMFSFFVARSRQACSRPMSRRVSGVVRGVEETRGPEDKRLLPRPAMLVMCARGV